MPLAEVERVPARLLEVVVVARAGALVVVSGGGVRNPLEPAPGCAVVPDEVGQRSGLVLVVPQGQDPARRVRHNQVRGRPLPGKAVAGDVTRGGDGRLVVMAEEQLAGF